MDYEQHERGQEGPLADQLTTLVQSLQEGEENWVFLGKVEQTLGEAYPELSSIRDRDLFALFQGFSDHFDCRTSEEAGLPPLYFVRPRPTGPSPLSEKDLEEIKGKYPKPQDALTDWAFINFRKYDELADLALPEKWYYGDTPPKNDKVPLLKNYLNYTFKRLLREGKISITPDSTPPQETYAAFNTGLVDRKYDDIYALFKQNTMFKGSAFWYLLDFVVAGEDTGKTLVRVFNPLPCRADYFENKVENMLYDSTTGDLSCDYTHIIVERTRRFPLEFLEDNLTRDMMEIDGMTLQEAYQTTDRYRSKIFFQKLGQKIEDNQRVFNRLKNRFEDAVELALKRVQWNYKTAIPMYNPRSNKGSLLLPLCLVDENRVDLALVVVRHPSGSYQGETILPLFLAYSNSRLVSRPDSDWLNTDSINILSYEGDENEDDED